jgi:hypothetical protein
VLQVGETAAPSSPNQVAAAFDGARYALTVAGVTGDIKPRAPIVPIAMLDRAAKDTR